MYIVYLDLFSIRKRIESREKVRYIEDIQIFC